MKPAVSSHFAKVAGVAVIVCDISDVAAGPKKEISCIF